MLIFGTGTNPDTIRWKLVKDRFTRLLRQGTSPRQLAWSLTWGLWIGIFPILGTCHLTITFIALRYRLNEPAFGDYSVPANSASIQSEAKKKKLCHTLIGSVVFSGRVPSFLFADLPQTPTFPYPLFN